MSGINSAQEREIGEKVGKIPTNKPYRFLWYFFIVLISIIVFCPIYQSKAQAAAGSGVVSISAIVPFNLVFAEAVASNSTLSVDRTIIFTGQDMIIKTIFSNGETIFKNESFVCDIVGNDGRLKFSYSSDFDDKNTDGFVVKISDDMIGRNTITCRDTGYEQIIQIKKEIIFFVAPNAMLGLKYFMP
jgi:hypothetical protein